MFLGINLKLFLNFIRQAGIYILGIDSKQYIRYNVYIKD